MDRAAVATTDTLEVGRKKIVADCRVRGREKKKDSKGAARRADRRSGSRDLSGRQQAIDSQAARFEGGSRWYLNDSGHWDRCSLRRRGDITGKEICGAD
jgi:hypothetical protein